MIGDSATFKDELCHQESLENSLRRALSRRGYRFTIWISVPFLWNFTSSISWLMRKIPRPELE